MSVTLDRGHETPLKSKDKTFSVSALVDLNKVGELEVPTIIKETRKYPGSLVCIGGGEISAAAGLNKAGFVPGENIGLNVNIQNK